MTEESFAGHPRRFAERSCAPCWTPAGSDNESSARRQGADSDDCGRGFRLNAAMRSDRRRPPVPIEGGWGRCRHKELIQVFLAASSLARWAAILRMLSPLSSSRWAL
jgi:hypothetical protein